jgi:hypothetical protein
MELKQAEIAAHTKTAASPPIIGEKQISSNDKFYFS